MRDRLNLTFLTTAIVLAAAQPIGAQQLGKPLTEADIAPWDISIAPDGRGLPDGTGTAAEGLAVYEDNCSSCHGDAASGGPAGSLAENRQSQPGSGNEKTVGNYWPYSTTVFDYIRRAMPYWAPGSLTDEEVYAVTAYILHVNGIISENYVLDAVSLPAVRMPNRNGFVSYWPAPPE
ncbi:MAG: cytochrome c [Pseudomonadota bacterium]